MNALQSIACGGAALVLGSAAARKALDHRGFRAVLVKHPKLRPVAPLLTPGVPAVEALLTVLLLVLPTVTVPTIAASVLFIGFLAVTHTAPPGDCGCGPFVPERRSWRDLMNIAFALALPLSLIDGAASPRGDRLLVVTAALVALLTFKLGHAALTTGRQIRGSQVQVAPARVPVDIPVRLVSRP